MNIILHIVRAVGHIETGYTPMAIRPERPEASKRGQFSEMSSTFSNMTLLRFYESARAR